MLKKYFFDMTKMHEAVGKIQLSVKRRLYFLRSVKCVDHTIRRGDIYYADLSPVVGSEQGGIRPVLIVQNDVFY